jgi:hypothetical protein
MLYCEQIGQLLERPQCQVLAQLPAQMTSWEVGEFEPQKVGAKVAVLGCNISEPCFTKHDPQLVLGELLDMN